MKRYIFIVVFTVASLVLGAEETYVPGRLSVIEIPFPGSGAERSEAVVSALLRDISRPEFCYVKHVSLLRKAGVDFVLVEFLPWLEGENTIASFTVDGKQVGEFTVKAELDPTGLYVPQAKSMLDHEGLNFRLLLYFVASLTVGAAAAEALRSRKRWLAFFRLRYRFAIAADKLRKNLRSAQQTKSWRVMDKAVRAYIETVSELFSSHPGYGSGIEPLCARSLTADEIKNLACGPDPLKAEIINLLAAIEQTRWGAGGGEFQRCLEASLCLPALFRENILQHKNAEGASPC